MPPGIIILIDRPVTDSIRLLLHCICSCISLDIIKGAVTPFSVITNRAAGTPTPKIVLKLPKPNVQVVHTVAM